MIMGFFLMGARQPDTGICLGIGASRIGEENLRCHFPEGQLRLRQFWSLEQDSSDVHT
jgi:hypothetical protein